MESQTSPTPPAAPVIVPPPTGLSPEEEKAARRTQIIIIVAAVVFVLFIIGAIVLMASFPAATVVARDIAIVFVAATTFFIGVAMIVLIIEIQVLINMLRHEIQPLLHSVNDTASTVRGTTEFVSQNLVSPIIKAAGFAAGVRQVTGDLISVVRGVRPRAKPVQPVQQGGKDGKAGE